MRTMDPITTLAAGAIAKIALDEFAKAGAGEIAKKTAGGAIDLVKTLRDKISARFKGNAKAEAALVEAQQQGTSEAIAKVGKYLDLELDDDSEFANEVRKIAQQIINIQNQTISTRNYTNQGRDQINIETMQGNQKIGGS
jgi:phosphoribosylformylglycinamidine (FGAM) synthase PurS component